MDHNLRATSRPGFVSETPLFLASVESSDPPRADPPRGLKRAAPAESSASSPKRPRAAVKVLHSGPTSDAAKVLAFWAGHELESSDGAGHALKSPDAKRAKSAVPKSAAPVSSGPTSSDAKSAKFARLASLAPKNAVKLSDLDFKTRFFKPNDKIPPKKTVLKFPKLHMPVGGVSLAEADLVDAVHPETCADGCKHFHPAIVIELDPNGESHYAGTDEPAPEVLVRFEATFEGGPKQNCWVPLDQVPKP
jgi:hypothetical protein